MRKIIVLGVFILSTHAFGSLGFFDTPLGNPESTDPEVISNDDTGSGQKIYLPAPDKIYKDTHGQYFYISRKDQNRMGGSGGFFVGSFGLTAGQKNSITQQLSNDAISETVQDNMILIGGGGYWHAGTHFYLGGSGAGSVMTIGSGTNQLKYSIGYGGVDFLILIPFGSDNVNVIVGSLLGAGGMEIDSKSTNKYNKAFWVIEPKVGIQLNFTDYFSMRLLASYLYSQDISTSITGTMANPSTLDNDTALRNSCVRLVFDWGSF